jgi:hypothetical protein
MVVGLAAPCAAVEARTVARRLSALVAVAVFAGGCAVPGGSTGSAGPATESSRPATDLTATKAPAAPSANVLTATDGGLTMTVTMDQVVESGGTIPIDVSISNGRSVPVVLPSDECGAPAGMRASLPVPLEPIGRTWDGIAAEYKAYALGEGYREGGLAASAPGWVMATAGACKPGRGELTIPPGEAASVALLWTAALVEGVAALPGSVPFTVSVAHDKGPEFTFPPDWTGPVGGIIPDYQVLSVEGTLDIVGDVPSVLSAGQAIDVVLADERFAAWLTEQPKKSWAVANVYLTSEAMDMNKPVTGPHWNVELIREPRDVGIGVVDAITGELLDLRLCPFPCDL